MTTCKDQPNNAPISKRKRHPARVLCPGIYERRQGRFNYCNFFLVSPKVRQIQLFLGGKRGICLSSRFNGNHGSMPNPCSVRISQVLHETIIFLKIFKEYLVLPHIYSLLLCRWTRGSYSNLSFFSSTYVCPPFSFSLRVMSPLEHLEIIEP